MKKVVKNDEKTHMESFIIKIILDNDFLQYGYKYKIPSQKPKKSSLKT